MFNFPNGQEKGGFRDKLNTPPLHGIGGSFKRAQSGDNRYGIANCPQLDDGHTVVLMVIGSPLALSDAHFKGNLLLDAGSRSYRHCTASIRRYLFGQELMTSDFG